MSCRHHHHNHHFRFIPLLLFFRVPFIHTIFAPCSSLLLLTFSVYMPQLNEILQSKLIIYCVWYYCVYYMFRSEFAQICL